MTVTRSQTKHARNHAVEYGNWIIEELARLPITEVEDISHLLMEVISKQVLRWRIMYEPSFRSQIRAQCETYVTALSGERDILNVEVWSTATATEMLKHRANMILRDSAKYV